MIALIQLYINDTAKEARRKLCRHRQNDLVKQENIRIVSIHCRSR